MRRPRGSSRSTRESLARSIAGVEAVHQIKVHQYGDHKEISLHVLVPGTIDLHTAHEVAARVEQTVASSLDARVLVHIDPVKSEVD